MTKNDKIKLGVAIGAMTLAIIVLIWHFFLSAPAATPVEPLPEGTQAPNARTPK
jgi:hypothetical protein